MYHHQQLLLDDHRRPPTSAAIDITWISCRGVKSPIPFHTPCLHASISLSSSAEASGRRPPSVKTATDRAGGESPEWDAPLRLYLPEGEGSGSDSLLLLLRFELKAEVAVLGDVLAASAAVPLRDLPAGGHRPRRVSYQLLAPDGRHPNGVLSFSYVLHGSKNVAAGVLTPPPSLAAATSPSETVAPVGLYPVIDSATVYPPLADSAAVYPPPPPLAATAGPVALYPALPPEPASSSCPKRSGAQQSYPKKEFAHAINELAAAVEPIAVYPPVLLEPASSYYPPPCPKRSGTQHSYPMCPKESETQHSCPVKEVAAVEPIAVYPPVLPEPASSYYPPLLPTTRGCGYPPASDFCRRRLYS